MAKKKSFQRVIRPATREEKRRHDAIRKKVMKEFPPAPAARRKPSPPGIPSQIRAARESRGLTWFSAAQLAGISSPNTVRDIEYGRDAALSSIQALARALGLKLELVEVETS